MIKDLFDSESNHTKEYQIRVKGCLSDDFLTWLDLSGNYDPQADETHLLVTVSDQAALYGLFNRLRDLGLTLASVEINPGKTL